MSGPPELLGPLVAGADPAMALVTTRSAAGEHGGCLVGFHCQCSISPERYAVWLSVTNHTYGLARDATHLAVHFLASGDRALAERFGGSSGDDLEGGGDGKFAGLTWREAAGGVPLLAAVDRWFVGRIVDRRAGGDHEWIELAPVEGVELSEQGGPDWTPLRLSDVDDVDPGHDP